MAEFIKGSWPFPVIQSVHLIGLTLLVGTIFLIDLRLLGIALLRYSPSDLGSRFAPWTNGGFLTVLMTGPLMFWSDIVRYIHNPAFLVKMALLAAALIGHFTLHRGVVRGGAMFSPAKQKLAAVLSLILWSSVVLAGRAIADFDTRAY